MEWVETTGRTLDEAREAALDELGVDQQDAEFEIVTEPKLGLFGRVRTEGRIRARVKPSIPRPKDDRRDRRRRSSKGRTAEAAAGAEQTTAAPADAEEVTPAPADATGSPRGRRRRSAAPPTAPEEETSGSASSRRRSSRSAASVPPAPDLDGPEADTADPTADSSAPDAVPEDVQPPAGRRNPRRTSTTPASNDPTSGTDRRRDHPAQPEETTVDVALDEQAAVAQEFLTGLLDSFGLDGSVSSAQPDDDTVALDLQGADLGLLIGPKGATLAALQDLMRAAVQRTTGAGNGRLYLDVAGYRQKRNEALARFARKIAADALASGQRIALEPMSAADRKVVHDTVTDIDGVDTVSQGEDAQRHVVVVPAG